MRKFKLLLLLVILVLVGLVGYQNQDFFLEKHIIKVNLIEDYQTPEIHTGLYLIGFFLVGLLISYFSAASLTRKKKRTFLQGQITTTHKKSIKKLNVKINAHLETISELKNELGSLKYGGAARNKDESETIADNDQADSASGIQKEKEP